MFSTVIFFIDFFVKKIYFLETNLKKKSHTIPTHYIEKTENKNKQKSEILKGNKKKWG